MTEEKFAILNATKIIEMLDEAKLALWYDGEQTAFILEELMSILRDADDVNVQLAGRV